MRKVFEIKIQSLVSISTFILAFLLFTFEKRARVRARDAIYIYNVRIRTSNFSRLTERFPMIMYARDYSKNKISLSRPPFVYANKSDRRIKNYSSNTPGFARIGSNISIHFFSNNTLYALTTVLRRVRRIPVTRWEMTRDLFLFFQI